MWTKQNTCDWQRWTKRHYFLARNNNHDSTNILMVFFAYVALQKCAILDATAHIYDIDIDIVFQLGWYEWMIYLTLTVSWEVVAMHALSAAYLKSSCRFRLNKHIDQAMKTMDLISHYSNVGNSSVTLNKQTKRKIKFIHNFFKKMQSLKKTRLYDRATSVNSRPNSFWGFGGIGNISSFDRCVCCCYCCLNRKTKQFVIVVVWIVKLT